MQAVYLGRHQAGRSSDTDTELLLQKEESCAGKATLLCAGGQGYFRGGWSCSANPQPNRLQSVGYFWVLARRRRRLRGRCVWFMMNLWLTMKLRLSRIENEANCMEASRYRRYCDVLRNKRDLERSCEFYRNRTQFLELHERRQLKQANQLRRQKLGPSKCDSTESVTFLTEKPTAPIGESANLQHNLPWWKVRRC